MVDSIISIMIRDPVHPCGPYDRTGHSFRVDIFNCDFTPLFYKGITYNNFPLNVKGKKGGSIHRQIRVPPGFYLIRGHARCHNVVTEWAMVQVGCGTTVCVNLLPTSIHYCLLRTVGAILATDQVKKIYAKEADEVVRAINKLLKRMPRTLMPAPPTAKQLEELENEEKEEEKKEAS